MIQKSPHPVLLTHPAIADAAVIPSQDEEVELPLVMPQLADARDRYAHLESTGGSPS